MQAVKSESDGSVHIYRFAFAFTEITTLVYRLNYCKSGNFRDNFIFANSVKRHICDAKNSRLGHGVSLSVDDRVISLFLEGFILTKFREVS